MGAGWHMNKGTIEKEINGFTKPTDESLKQGRNRSWCAGHAPPHTHAHTIKIKTDGRRTEASQTWTTETMKRHGNDISVAGRKGKNNFLNFSDLLCLGSFDDDFFSVVYISINQVAGKKRKVIIC